MEELRWGIPEHGRHRGPRAELYRPRSPGGGHRGAPPVLWDERRTTVDAHRILFVRENARKRKTVCGGGLLILEDIRS
ncbi:MAG: hypothetical protein ACLTYN_14815 [Dysosmobacter welbionis]